MAEKFKFLSSGGMENLIPKMTVLLGLETSKLSVFFYVYVFLLLCMFCSVYSVFIVPNGTFAYPG